MNTPHAYERYEHLVSAQLAPTLGGMGLSDLPDLPGIGDAVRSAMDGEISVAEAADEILAILVDEGEIPEEFLD